MGNNRFAPSEPSNTTGNKVLQPPSPRALREKWTLQLSSLQALRNYQQPSSLPSFRRQIRGASNRRVSLRSHARKKRNADESALAVRLKLSLYSSFKFPGPQPRSSKTTPSLQALNTRGWRRKSRPSDLCPEEKKHRRVSIRGLFDIVLVCSFQTLEAAPKHFAGATYPFKTESHIQALQEDPRLPQEAPRPLQDHSGADPETQPSSPQDRTSNRQTSNVYLPSLCPYWTTSRGLFPV